MKKFLALFLGVALLMSGALAAAQEAPSSEIVYAASAGGADAPGYDTWLKALTLPQVESYEMVGEMDGVQCAGETLILSADVFDLQTGQCALPAPLAKSANLAVGAQVTLTLPDGGERAFTLAETYEPSDDEDAYLPGGYAFICPEDLADIAGRDTKNVFWPTIIFCKNAADVPAFLQQANELLKDEGVQFISIDDLDDNFDLPDPSPIDGPLTIDGTDLNGQAVDNKVLNPEGVTLINVWATFCGPCVEEMPGLGKLMGEYPNVKFVGICADLKDATGNLDPDQVAFAAQIARETGAAYPHIAPGPALEGGLLANVFAYPTTLFADEQGNILATYVGSRDYDGWKAIIDEIITPNG